MRPLPALLAYIGCLIVGRLGMTSTGLSLLPLAPGALFVWLALSRPSRWLPVAGAAAFASASIAILFGDPAGGAIHQGLGHALGALCGVAVLTRRQVDLRAVETTWTAVFLIQAAVVDAAAAAFVAALPFALGDPGGAFTAWHVHLATDLAGIATIVPPTLVALRGVRASLQGRGVEMFVLLTAVSAATAAMWSGTHYPKPGLLAPFFVWAVLRFPMASGLVNVTFALTGIALIRWGRSPWAGQADGFDLFLGVWLHLIVTGAFLALSAGILERRRAQQLMRAVLDGVSDGILVVNDAGAVQTLNKSALTMFRAAFHDAAGRPSRDLLSDAVPAAASARDLEVVATRPDGTTFPAQVSISPVSSEGRRFSVAVVRDLSREREAERSLAVSEAQWRTERQSLEDQLRQAQKLEAIGRLAGGVAHDFNNLLTVIGGSTELMLDTVSEGDANRRALQEVREATARAALLTQQLLAFGRRQILQAEVFDLGQVVRGCEQMLRRLIGEHIRLTCDFGPRLPLVRADRGQIEQVIVNLAVNARDAMPTGGDLRIRADSVVVTGDADRIHHEQRPGHYVTLTVTDTGTGIPADVLEHVFEPFFTTKETGRGTGLGLATVYGVVHQSDGFIAVSSRESEGTTFVIHLPAVATAGATPSPGTLPAALERGADETVLLVEDEAAVREVALRFISGAGYRVLAAGSGAEALSVLDAHRGPLHLLLSDVVMPGMSGPELAALVGERHPQARVLFMSGYPDDALRAHRMADVPATFIQKPFSRHALIGAVQEILSTPPAAAVER